MNLRKRQPDHPRGYRAPALNLLCIMGFASSLAAILISFVPPRSSVRAARPLRRHRRRRDPLLG
jgi:hypothetical protein